MDFFYAEPGSLWVLPEPYRPNTTIKPDYHVFEMWLTCKADPAEATDIKFIPYKNPIMKLVEKQTIEWKWAKGNGGFNTHYHQVLARDHENIARVGWMRLDELNLMKRVVSYD